MAQKKLAALAAALLALVAAAVPAAAAEASADAQVQLLPGEQPAVGYKQLPRPPNELGQEDLHATMDAWLERFFAEQARRPPRRPEELVPPDDTSLLERLIGKQEEGASCGVDEQTEGPVKRDYLVVLPAGDDFDASKWVNDPGRANWDLVVIYFGAKPEQFSCPLCLAVYAASGPKWRLVYRFTLLEEWQHFRQAYKAIMLPDDDLVLDTCTVNRIFSVLEAYDLLYAQPSLCQAAWSHTPWEILFQQPQHILRFTTFVEIMSPVYRMDFFDGFVRPSLYNAFVGWGLDFVWPFLLKYPRDKIAVIDEVCIYHPPANPQKSNNVYLAEAPYNHKEEEARRFAEYGYFESAIQALGSWWQQVEVVGVVPRPVRRESLLETSNKILSSKLGNKLPLLLLGQAMVIAFGCLAVVCLRLRQCGLQRRQYKPLVASAIV